MFITFEGGEGSGKSTQIVLLRDYLVDAGVDVVVTREPGGTAIGDAIRKILLDGANHDMTAECELLLYAGARAQHVRRVIAPALAAGKSVLCDRFTDATHIYQGVARGLSPAIIGELEKFVLAEVQIHHTILLDLPANVGLSRARKRLAAVSTKMADEGRFEEEAITFHERVRQGYLERAKREPRRFFTVNGALSVAEQARLIANQVKIWMSQ